MRPSDHYKMLMHELTSVGIRPDISTTKGGHLQLLFEVKGQRERIITSSTPSDFRATLNARGNIRRALRKAGVYNEVRPKPLPLEKALAIPTGVDPLPYRIEQLEHDLGVMLELFAEINDRVDAAFVEGWRAGAKAIRDALDKVAAPPASGTSFASGTSVAPAKIAQTATNDIAAHADKPPRRQTKPQLLLAKLQYDRWMTREDMADATGMSLGSISTYLTDLRKAKLVDNQNRMWRRRAPPPVTETTLVAAPRLDNLKGIATGHAHNA
ncbi:MAG TPA: hypothetical protein VGJ01_14690 [Pseudolabrys sp.]|jgi:hypothetical protein